MARRRRDPTSSDEEDEILFRYPLQTTAASSSASGGGPTPRGGSGGLAPSKSTIYVSNIDFSLTNSDLHTIFSTFGKVARVTILKDRSSPRRQSRGVAFVLYVCRHDAAAAVVAMHGKVLNGRTISVSIAADNGRSPEFIKKRVYKDKSRCYECGEEGHLSYECPKNVLGPRERPPPKKERREGGGGGGGRRVVRDDGDEEEEEEEGVGFEVDDWASAVDPRGREERRDGKEERKREKKKKKKQSSYFSDESGDED